MTTIIIGRDPVSGSLGVGVMSHGARSGAFAAYMAAHYPDKLAELRARVHDAYGAVMAEWNRTTPFLLGVMQLGGTGDLDAGATPASAPERRNDTRTA